jgi:hypothetical protein
MLLDTNAELDIWFRQHKKNGSAEALPQGSGLRLEPQAQT